MWPTCDFLCLLSFFSKEQQSLCRTYSTRCLCGIKSFRETWRKSSVKWCRCSMPTASLTQVSGLPAPTKPARGRYILYSMNSYACTSLTSMHDTCKCSSAHTHMHACLQAHIYRHTETHACMHANTHTHTHIHTHMCTLTHTCMPAGTHTCTHIYIYSLIHMHSHTHT